MGTDLIAALLEVGRAQAGCFSLAQARSAGASQGQLLRMEKAGVVERIHPKVLVFASASGSTMTRSWAARLQGGEAAVLSHEAALRIHGVGHVPFEPVITVVPESHHLIEGVRVHRLCDLIDEHRAAVDGMPVTTIPRAVVDVTSVFATKRLADLVDRVTITERRTSIGAIARVYRQVNRRGRVHIANLGGVLDARSSEGPVVCSLLERSVDELIAAAGLPRPIREMPLPSLDSRPGLVDRAWSDARLILEVDGRTWHSREGSMDVDRARDRVAGREGWYTARVLDEELRDQPDLVVDDLRALLEVRQAQFASRRRPDDRRERAA